MLKSGKLTASIDSTHLNLDFRNPENFFHDVNSVAGLLKLFFRDLPDPLLTKEHYSAFIEAASTPPLPSLLARYLTNPTPQKTKTKPSAATRCTPSSTASPTPTTRPCAP